MRRLLALLLLLMLCTGIPPAVRAEEDVTDIFDAAGLQAMAARPGGTYRLARDIDLRGIDWVPPVFSGTLDGNGHTIYNLTIRQAGEETRVAHDGNLKAYDTAFAGLFAVLDHATVRNLSLKGALVELEHPGHCFAALLTGFMDHAVIENVSVEGRVHLATQGVMVGVGGLAGYGCGRFEGCGVEVELVFEDRNRQSRCEQFLGAVLACGICSMNACTVHLDAYNSCHGYAHNGGLMGMYFHCNTGYPRGPVTNCAISGRITFFEDNRDRRAYCRPGIGEHLQRPTSTRGCSSRGFKKKEVRKFDRVLSPETCESPVYDLAVTEPTADAWGFTRHTCTGCGYTWTDTYTPPTAEE